MKMGCSEAASGAADPRSSAGAWSPSWRRGGGPAWSLPARGAWDPHRRYEELLELAYPLRPPRGAGLDVRSPPRGPAGAAAAAPGASAGRCEGDDEFLSLPPRLGAPHSLARYLSGLCPGAVTPARRRPSARDAAEGLAQSVKRFCGQLEELIRWLYDVADVAERWVPPAPGGRSTAAAVQRYLELRRDVAEHRGLARSVLCHGEALLQCMASSSPALKDTLDLIARQSEELEGHVERLHTSVLAALDTAAAGVSGAPAAEGRGAGAGGRRAGRSSPAPPSLQPRPLADLASLGHFHALDG